MCVGSERTADPFYGSSVYDATCVAQEVKSDALSDLYSIVIDTTCVCVGSGRYLPLVLIVTQSNDATCVYGK